MAYIKDAVMDKLTEQNQLILHLIDRLDSQADAISEIEDVERQATAFSNIRFLTRELARLGEL